MEVAGLDIKYLEPFDIINGILIETDWGTFSPPGDEDLLEWAANSQYHYTVLATLALNLAEIESQRISQIVGEYQGQSIAPTPQIDQIVAESGAGSLGLVIKDPYGQYRVAYPQGLDEAKANMENVYYGAFAMSRWSEPVSSRQMIVDSVDLLRADAESVALYSLRVSEYMVALREFGRRMADLNQQLVTEGLTNMAVETMASLPEWMRPSEEKIKSFVSGVANLAEEGLAYLGSRVEGIAKGVVDYTDEAARSLLYDVEAMGHEFIQVTKSKADELVERLPEEAKKAGAEFGKAATSSGTSSILPIALAGAVGLMYFGKKK